MEKRTISSLRVVQKKKKKSNKKRTLFRKSMAYLTSDSYMFAPLLSSHPSSKQISASASAAAESGYVAEEERKKKTLMGKVGDFFKSDCYMYAPLIEPPRSSCSICSLPTTSSLTAESPQTVAATPAEKHFKDTEPPSKIIAGKQQNSNSTVSTVLRKTVAYHGTVKHMVHLNCRSSSVPGVLHETEQRKLLIE